MPHLQYHMPALASKWRCGTLQVLPSRKAMHGCRHSSCTAFSTSVPQSTRRCAARLAASRPERTHATLRCAMRTRTMHYVTHVDRMASLPLRLLTARARHMQAACKVVSPVPPLLTLPPAAAADGSARTSRHRRAWQPACGTACRRRAPPRGWPPPPQGHHRPQRNRLPAATCWWWDPASSAATWASCGSRSTPALRSSARPTAPTTMTGGMHNDGGMIGTMTRRAAVGHTNCTNNHDC